MLLPLRANSERLSHRKWLQIISPFRCTMIPEVFLPITERHVLFAPPISRKRPVEAETFRNSLSWKILQVTPLF